MIDNGQEIAVQADSSIAVARPPELVLAEAKKAADALQQVIKGKKNPVIFNNEQYIEFEDWQMLGKFYGFTVKVVEGSTRPVQFGTVLGFEARAVVLDNRTGLEISGADSMCLNDEDRWSARAKYEWKDGKKSKTGEVPVPMFQLRSMAQTRACAKALRNVLAWVVVLAGYNPTPAEEVDERTVAANGPAAPATPQRKSEAAPTTGTPPPAAAPATSAPAPAAAAATPPPAAPVAGAKSTKIAVVDIQENSFKRKDGSMAPYWIIVDQNDQRYTTFDDKTHDLAVQIAGTDQMAEITYTTSQYGHKIKTFNLVAEVGA